MKRGFCILLWAGVFAFFAAPFAEGVYAFLSFLLIGKAYFTLKAVFVFMGLGGLVGLSLGLRGKLPGCHCRSGSRPHQLPIIGVNSNGQ